MEEQKTILQGHGSWRIEFSCKQGVNGRACKCLHCVLTLQITDLISSQTTPLLLRPFHSDTIKCLLNVLPVRAGFYKASSGAGYQISWALNATW